jgi:PRTRC genetic system protein B
MTLLPEPLPGEVAALIITDDQYVFRHRAGERETLKFVSPASVRAAFSHEPIDSGWLPCGTQRWGLGPAGHWAVLFIPAQIHPLLFNADPIFGGGAGIARLNVPLPPLVFMGHAAAYHIWALDHNAFDPKARMYHAPLPNVHPDGLVCFGANLAPDAARIGQAWQLFLASPFNADLASGKSKAQPNDVRAQLRNLADNPHKTYPPRDLVPWTQTVDQAVEAILRRSL